MVAIGRKTQGPKPSKYLPKNIEDELRHLVLDGVEDSPPVGGDAPQLIIPNVETGCHGTYFQRGDGVEFYFHHKVGQCQCMVLGTHEVTTYQIPRLLDDYRIQLIRGRGFPFRVEPKLAAIVVMKTFMGLHVPEELRIFAEADDLEIDLATREERPASGKGKGKLLEQIPEEEDDDECEDVKDEEA
ncbi:hypothetical protein GGR51DRAFT_555554 [Nemania sp. FL0031]|nr:hypothetical protein GGR51DRAFT_555554 [Nemania sp. FL0031]